MPTPSLHYQIRARRFADLTHLDTSRRCWATRWASPLYVSAVSSQRAFHPEAELAVARAAQARGAPGMMLSTGCSATLEAVAEAAGQPPWQQLYPTDDCAVTAAIVRRAERAGAPAIVVTVDSAVLRPQQRDAARAPCVADNRNCAACHASNSHDMWLKAADVRRARHLARHRPRPAGAHVGQWFDRLRGAGEGAADGQGHRHRRGCGASPWHMAWMASIVSNHGGRNEETLRASIDCVPEVVAAVNGKVPVFVDGGIRRGTDIFKALALGATAVGIGRPQAWGLAAFGQPGVEAVIDILNRELAAIMRQAGTPTLADITPAHVLRA